MFTFKSGLDRGRIVDASAKTLDTEGAFIVTVNEDMKPGEYMLTFSSLGIQGYNFGIAKGEK